MKCSERTGWDSVTPLLLLVIVSAACVYYLPAYVWDPASYHFILIVGIITLWRYGWRLINFVRAALYKFIKYPFYLKPLAERNAPPIRELYIMITSYRIPPEVNFRVYMSIFREANRLDCPVKVVSLSTDPADFTLFEKIRARIPAPNVEVFTIFQEGKGKRPAMFEGMRFIKNLGPHPDADIVFMDGDCVLGEGVLEQAHRILHVRPTVGAVTTNNRACVVDDRTIVREWYNLRMSNRDFYMCSLALSNKVLVLTGRFSMFRAQAIMSDEFILNMKYDYIRHWRFHRVRMLTGDDKTTWYHLIKDGWDMLYLPDAWIYPVEELPQRSFFRSTVALSRRWYGNMLRNNGRALKLGPHRIGLFPWLALLDQRISIWTTLSAPFFALIIILFVSASFFWMFLLWLIITRSLQALLLFLITRDIHPLYIPLYLYDQYVGSFIKSYVSFHLNKQKWNRQNIQTEGSTLQTLTSTLLWLGTLILMLSLLYTLIVNTEGINLVRATTGIP